MIYPFSRKPIRTSAPTRIAVAARTRPLLDVQVGASLWKDRRVSVVTKAVSLGTGVVAMILMMALDYLLARWMVGPQATGQLSVSSLALSGGSILFSTIALLRLAPAGVVNLVRLERGGVIPLRTSKR